MSPSVAEGVLFSIRPAVPSPIVAGGEPELFLLSVFYAPGDHDQVPYVELEGISAQVTNVLAAIRLDGVEVGTPLETQPNPGDGRWHLRQELPAAGGLLAVQLGDETGGPRESAVVNLPPRLAPVPAGSLLNLGEEVTDLLAGSSDRLIRARSFTLIEHPVMPWQDLIPSDPSFSAAASRLAIYSQGAAGQQAVASAGDFRTALADVAETVRSEANARSYDDKAIRRLVTARLKEPLRRVFHVDRITEKGRRLLAKFPSGGAEFDSDSGEFSLVLPRLNMRLTSPARREADSGLLVDAVMVWLTDRPSRLGICFDEFFRFRAAGLVRGEPIYSLAMDAGEEVQLKQTSETVRSETYEEVLERESERSLTLSSTWSTDVSVAFNQSKTDSSAWNVGGDAGFSGVPKLPLNIGVSGGFSAATAAQNSVGLTVQNAYQLSRQAMARLRAQHKTRLEVQDQTSIGVSSVRSLNNRGAVRPRRVDFFKMYRKEMATYERHEARLCLKLVVDDPAQIMRQEFERNLDGIDPASEQHYDALPSPPASVTSTLSFKWRPDQPLNILPLGVTSVETLQVDLRDNGSTIPSSYLLVRQPKLEMVKVTYYWKKNWLDEDTDLSYTAADEGLVETSPGIKVVSHFANYTLNTLKWLVPPVANSPNGTGTLNLKYQNHTDLLTGGQVTVEELKLEITSEWAPPNDEVTAFMEERDAISQQVQNELTAEGLLRLRDIAVADYPGKVLALAMHTHLSAGEPASQVNPHDFRAWFAIEDAYIENAPYWATPAAMERYTTLRARLSGLNPGIPLSDILVPELTASQAVLYLPIRPGAEEDALSLLSEYPGDHIKETVKEFRKYREETFGPTEPAADLPKYQDISSPTVVTGTALGKADWETPWEPAQRKFQVLAQWADYVPTDGLDAQTVLSTTSKADEAVLRGVAEDAKYLG